MAIINPNIVMQAANIPRVQISRPESMAESLTAIAPGINAMRQLEASRVDLEEKKRQRDALAQMRQQNLDPEGVAQWFVRNGTPEQMQFGMKMLEAAREEKMFRQAFPQPQAAGAPNALIPAPTAMPAQPAAQQPGGFPMTPEQLGRIAASGERGAKFAATMGQFIPKPQTEPSEIQTMRAMGLNPQNPEDVKRFYAAKQPQLATAEARLELDRRRLDLDNLRQRQAQAKSEADAARLQTQIAQQERRLELEQRKFDRESDPEYQARISEARAFATEAAKNDATLAQQGPSAIQSGEQTLALLNRMVGDPKAKGAAAQPHPGFRGVVGATLMPGMRLVQGTPEADFDAMLEQVLGGAFLEAYERLKGTGQITEIEGKKATQAITRMQRAVSETEFLQAAQEFRSSLEKAMERTRNRLQGVSNRTSAPSRPTAPTAPAGNFPTPNQAAIDALKRGQGTDEQFDAVFGPGAAARVRGR
jgi:hypothetical protein